MRKALVTGGTSKFGAALVKQLEKTYEVEIIPREVISGGEHNISLMDLDGHYNPKHDSYDLVFFNHHAFPEKFDVQTYQKNMPRTTGYGLGQFFFLGVVASFLFDSITYKNMRCSC